VGNGSCLSSLSTRASAASAESTLNSSVGGARTRTFSEAAFSFDSVPEGRREATPEGVPAPPRHQAVGGNDDRWSVQCRQEPPGSLALRELGTAEHRR